MRAYFSQFGTLTRLRLARNRATGAPKHYAFVEFASGAVADVVAATTDAYLLFGHVLRVRRVPRAQVHADLWKGSGKKFKRIPWGEIEARGLRVGREREVWEGRVQREAGRRERKAAVLQRYGYGFEMPRVRPVGEVPEKLVRERKSLALVDEAGGRDRGEEAGKVDPVTSTSKKTRRVKSKKLTISKE
jgi:nucleolar protein 15